VSAEERPMSSDPDNVSIGNLVLLIGSFVTTLDETHVAYLCSVEGMQLLTAQGITKASAQAIAKLYLKLATTHP
jgi:hypothetical protein